MVLPHCGMPTFYPKSVASELDTKEFKSVNHYTQFLDAIEGKDKTLAGFDYAGPLAESLCLGVVACQFPGKRLEWDAKKMHVTNHAAANPLRRQISKVLARWVCENYHLSKVRFSGFSESSGCPV